LSEVFQVNMHCGPNRGMLKKLSELCEKVGLEEIIERSDMVAVKTHMGEAGSTAFVPVMYVRTIAEEVKKLGGRPFVTDSNTLYVGGRATAINHLRTAAGNGFTMETVGAPIIIADGLKGHDFEEIEIEGELLKSVKIASAAYHVPSHRARIHGLWMRPQERVHGLEQPGRKAADALRYKTGGEQGKVQRLCEMRGLVPRRGHNHGRKREREGGQNRSQQVHGLR
jgi:hypothetical protein